MLVREIYINELNLYKEGVEKGLYNLSENEIKLLARADFYRRIALGDGKCSLNVQIDASQKLLKLRETNEYIEAENKLFTGRV